MRRTEVVLVVASVSIATAEDFPVTLLADIQRPTASRNTSAVAMVEVSAAAVSEKHRDCVCWIDLMCVSHLHSRVTDINQSIDER